MRRNVAGALSLVALVAGRETPHVERLNLTTERGLILNHQQFKNSRKNVVITTRRLYDAREV
ncbi:hypothetical protein, partial [Escherichia coli]|uniref:hypothetical protein n=1 Tax=Escherichia coli TaxID=562 RepID=UPI001B8D6DE0